MEDSVHRYIVGVETKSEEAKEALLNIIEGMESKNFNLLELVGSLQQFLISDEASIRAKGLSLLTGVLKEITIHAITQKDVAVFSQFYVERLHDKYCLSELLMGIEALQQFSSHFNTSEALSMVQGIFQAIRVQELSQSLRLVCFTIILNTLTKFPEGAKSLGVEFVKSVIEAVDGEKDPRNLIIVFKLIKETVFVCDASTQIEDIFDITFCYFPITFKSPKDDPFSISPVALKEGLRDVLSSTSLLGRLVIPSLLKTLSASSINAKKDSLDVLCSAVSVYDPEAFLSHLTEILAGLTEEVYHPLDDTVQELTFQVSEKLFSKLFSEANSQDIESVQTELTKITSDAVSRILESGSNDLKPASRFICALAKSHKNACSSVMTICVEPLMKAYQEAEIVTRRKALLETLSNFLSVYLHHYGSDPTSPEVLEATDPMLSASRALVGYFHEVIGFVSEYSELRKVAIKGLSTAIVLPQMIPMDEKEYFIQKTSHFFLEEEDSSVREVSLDCLLIISQYFPELNKKNCLPLFLEQLKGKSGHDVASKNHHHSIILNALVKLSLNTNLFTSIIDDLVKLVDDCFKGLSNGTPEFTCSLLTAVRAILENQLNINHSDLFQSLVSSLLKKIWLFSVLSSLSQNSYTPLGCHPDILGIVSQLSILVTRELTPSNQEVFLNDCYELFYGTDKTRFFDHVPGIDLTSFYPFTSSSTELQSRTSLLFAAVISSSRKEVPLAHIATGKFLGELVELVFATNHAMLQQSCAIIIATMLNKHLQESLMEFASKTCAQDLKFMALDFSASNTQRSKALNLLIWATKALITQGHNIGYTLLDSVFMLLQDSALGEEAALGLSNLLTDDEWYFSKRSYFVIRLLYKQRVFNTVFPTLSKTIKGCPQEMQHHYLLALAALLTHVTPQVIVREGEALLPLLKSSLMNSSFKIQEAAIKALKVLMAENAIPVSKLGFKPHKEGSQTLLELLLLLATAETGSESMSSHTRQFPIPVRIGALQCLALFPKFLAPHVSREDPEDDPTMMARLVSKRLARSLDDPKRLVRAEAVKCHHQWLTTAFSKTK